MYELKISKIKLRLEYDKLIQKYQVLLGVKYSIPIALIGLYFTVFESDVVLLGIIFGLELQERLGLKK